MITLDVWEDNNELTMRHVNFAETGHPFCARFATSHLVQMLTSRDKSAPKLKLVCTMAYIWIDGISLTSHLRIVYVDELGQRNLQGCLHVNTTSQA